jgi:hypothetical protein
MSATRHLARIAAPLALCLAFSVACAAPEDESVPPARSTPTSPTSAGGANAVMPTADETVSLDPVTKGKCDAIWSFGVFSYTASTTKDKSTAEHDRLHAGILEHEPHATAEVPQLAAQIKRLAEHAHEVMNSADSPPLPAPLVADNQAIVDYLKSTCKYKAE